MQDKLQIPHCIYNVKPGTLAVGIAGGDAGSLHARTIAHGKDCPGAAQSAQRGAVKLVRLGEKATMRR